MADAYSTLLIERCADGYAVVTLNRPEALNALNSTLFAELAAFLDVVETDDSVRCLILTGSAKAFAAGADIKEMADQSYADMFKGNFFALGHDRIMRFRKPIIAAVSGYALGGGCELAMLCDFIIASETAKFGQPEINLGVAPGIGGSQRLTGQPRRRPRRPAGRGPRRRGQDRGPEPAGGDDEQGTGQCRP